jgi:23S rRNA (cytidine1920-2'-O)/16S rRNA (cytidine1409-2'-O)-methyltransferase
VWEKFGFTRNKSQAFIRDGLVLVNKKVITKPSFEVINDEKIELKEERRIHWVSRSAGKLDGFLEQLRVSNCELRIIGTYCLDVGSSTWWFTQVLLERWVAHVDAIDVGTDQLHPSLKNDPRVTSYEQTDIRDFTPEKIYDIIVCDASFISLRGILLSILKLANSETDIILLWKPQFEVGRENLRKTWVPKDERVLIQKQKEWEEFIIANFCDIVVKEKSAVIGEAGNVEWLYYVKKM